MSSPPVPYARHTNFVDYEAAHPNEPKLGADLDGEFNGILATANRTVSRLNEIQRADGTLANGVVTMDALSADMAALLALSTDSTPRGAWLTATAYAVKDVVVSSGATYVCTTAHTSGTFATDLAAGKWILIAKSTVTPTYGSAARTLEAMFGDRLSVLNFTGVVADNATDCSPGVQAAVNSGAKKVYIPAGSYRFATAVAIPTSVCIEGDGGNNTQITNDSNDFAFTMTNCQGSGIDGLYIYSSGTDGADKGVKIQQTGTGGSLSNFVRNCWFDGHTQGAVGTTGHQAISVPAAVLTYPNYFNNIENCVFKNWNTALFSAANGNANFISKCLFWSVWNCISGSMQEWIGRMLWVHGTIGSGSDYAYSINLGDDGAGLNAQYNDFEFTQETGVLTKVYNFGAGTARNRIAGHWQAPLRGLDAGSNNIIEDYVAGDIKYGGVHAIGIQKLYSLLSLNDFDTNSAGALTLFGDGTNAQAGSGQQKLKLMGGSGETRSTQLSQTISGDGLLESSAGLSLQGTGYTKVGDGAWNGSPMRLGAYYIWVSSGGKLYIKSSAPANDTDGTIIGTQS